MVLYDRAMIEQVIQTSKTLAEVKYEIRGQLAHRAGELEKQGYEILSLNIGNPGLFGFRTPETMRLAMIENLGRAEPYSHQKGIFPAREAGSSCSSRTAASWTSLLRRSLSAMASVN